MFLHFFLYGCNIFMWRKTRVNYSFIFELAQTKELKYRDVFLICTTSMTAVIGVLFLHLTLVAKGYSYNQIQAIPALLLVVIFLLLTKKIDFFRLFWLNICVKYNHNCFSQLFILLLVCPFNIIYKSSRYRFICVIRNIMFSPLYKVVMLDFFMADQLCSQVSKKHHYIK